MRFPGCALPPVLASGDLWVVEKGIRGWSYTSLGAITVIRSLYRLKSAVLNISKWVKIMRQHRCHQTDIMSGFSNNFFTIENKHSSSAHSRELEPIHVVAICQSTGSLESFV